MCRIVVGLLAGVGAAMSALVGLAHGDLVPVIAANVGVATGLAAYLALLPPKKNVSLHEKIADTVSENFHQVCHESFIEMRCGTGRVWSVR